MQLIPLGLPPYGGLEVRGINLIPLYPVGVWGKKRVDGPKGSAGYEFAKLILTPLPLRGMGYGALQVLSYQLR